MLTWISEGERLPMIAQTVLLAKPRQFGEFWDICTARILVRHEGVIPVPVRAGTDWPTDYWWSPAHGRAVIDSPTLVTGNSWWAAMDDLPLPPGAEHRRGPLGGHYFAQPVDVWIGKTKKEKR